MSVLLDTMVLVYAFRPSKATDSADMKDLRQRSQWVIAKEKDFRISAISVLEFDRGLRPNEQAAWAKVVTKINVVPVTAAIASHAGELLRKKQGQEAACPRCLSPKKHLACSKCGAAVSVQQNLNDALIAATAELDETIDTLYSTDAGMLHYSNYVSKARIVSLPNASGPLFDDRSKATKTLSPMSPAPTQSKPAEQEEPK